MKTFTTKECEALIGIDYKKVNQLVIRRMIEPENPFPGTGKSTLLSLKNLLEINCIHCMKGMGYKPIIMILEQLQKNFSDIFEKEIPENTKNDLIIYSNFSDNNEPTVKVAELQVFNEINFLTTLLETGKVWMSINISAMKRDLVEKIRVHLKEYKK